MTTTEGEEKRLYWLVSKINFIVEKLNPHQEQFT
jgi:hypothetical protein